MAITRITKGVIEPNENYDTHNINSTGIVTAVGADINGDLDVDGHTNLDNVSISGVTTFGGSVNNLVLSGVVTTTGLDVNGNADISGNLSVGGVLTYEDVTSIDSVGIITARNDIHVGAGVSAVGVGTFGSLDIGGDIDVDGHTELDNVNIAGVTTFNNNAHFKLNDRLYFGNNNELEIYQQGNNTFIFNNDDSFSIGQKSQGADHPMKIYGGNEFELKHHTSNGGQTSVFKSIRGGAFTLYHAGSNTPTADQIRLETTSTGINFPRDIDVSGQASLSGFTTTTSYGLTTRDLYTTGITTVFKSFRVEGREADNDGMMPFVVRHGGYQGIQTSLFTASLNNYPELVLENSWGGNWNTTGPWKLKWTSPNDGSAGPAGDGRILSELMPSVNNSGALNGFRLRATDGSTGLKNVFLLKPSQSSFYVTDSSGTTESLRINTTGIGITNRIYHIGDSDTSISFPSNNRIEFYAASTTDSKVLITNSTARFQNLSSGVDINVDLDVDGHTELDNVNVVGTTTITQSDQTILALNVTGNTSFGGGGNSGDVTFRGASSTNITFDKSSKTFDFDTGSSVRFGDNIYFQITGNDSQGLIRLEGGIPLNIKKSTTENIAKFIPDGAVELYHNNTKKFETTSTGISVTGGAVFTSTDAGSSAEPELKLFRNSASPADADYLGQIKFAGESDTGVERNYAKITGKILDASNGTEDGIIEFAHIKGGSQNISARFRSDSLQLLNDTNFSVNGTTTFENDVTFEVATGNGIKLDKSANQLLINSGTHIRFQIAPEVNTDDGKIGPNLFASGLNIVGSQTGSGLGRQIRLFGDLLTGNIKPTTDSAFSIGTSSNRFANIYADTLYGDGSNLTGVDTDLVSDTSPQLGGTLDVNGQAISFPDSNGTTNQARFGTGNDLKIYHQSNSSYIINSTGNLNIGSNNAVRILGGSDVAENMAVFNDNGAVNLYNDNVLTFNTQNGGIGVYDDDTTTFVELNTSGGIAGYLHGLNNSEMSLLDREGHYFIRGTKDGSTDLYYDNVIKLQTTSSGVDVSGRLTADDLTIENTTGNLSGYFTATNGLGTLEIGGSTGAFIDLKHPATDDYDMRLGVSGSNGYINTANNFNLYVKANENAIYAAADAGVFLYFNGSSKLQTTNYGTRVTGYQTQSSPVAFHAYHNNTISWNNSVITFNSEVFDYGGNYNTSNYRFTAPIAGLYFFGLRLMFATGFGSLNMKLRKNGSNVMRILGHAGASNGDVHTGFHIIALNSGDYIDILGSGNHGGVAGGADESAFYGYLIG